MNLFNFQNLVILIILVTGINTILSAQIESKINPLIAVISKKDRLLTFINPTTLKEEFNLPIPGGPHELTASPDGRFLYLANYHQFDDSPGHSISIIDVEARKEIKKVELGALLMPHGIIQAGEYLYFTSELTRTVGRYNLKTDSIDWIRGTGQSLTHIPVVSPDGARLYTTNMRSNSVTVIEINKNGQDPTGIKQIQVGKDPEGIAISPKGQELWIGHNGDGGVSVIDTQSLTVKKTFKVGEIPIRLCFTKDGKKVVIADPKAGQLMIYDAALYTEIKRIPIAGGPVSFALSPDEKFAFVSLIHAAKAVLIELESGNLLGSVSTGIAPDGIVWINTPR